MNDFNQAFLWEVDPVATGRQLQRHRQKDNLTQEDLSGIFAEKCVMTASRVIISMWETGKRIPSLLHLVFLAGLYGCPLDELVVPYWRSLDRELEDDDQPVPSNIITSLYIETNVCESVCSSFFLCIPEFY